jgi:hypothetical protein
VSAKLAPQICTNKASSNSRLTAAHATDSENHSQNSLQTLFFLSSFDETTTKVHLHAEKLTKNCIAFELGTLSGVYFFVLSVLFYFGFPVFFPFDETTTELLRHHLQDWRLRIKHQNY